MNITMTTDTYQISEYQPVAAGLADVLGLPTAATDGNAKLYNMTDWPKICDRLIQHVSSVRGMLPFPTAIPQGAA